MRARDRDTGADVISKYFLLNRVSLFIRYLYPYLFIILGLFHYFSSSGIIPV